MHLLSYRFFTVCLILISILANALIIFPGTMQGYTADIYSTLAVSLIVTLFGVYAIESAGRADKSSTRLSRRQAFYFDFNLMSYVTITATFLFILLERNNLDLRGWWLLIAFMLPLYGIIFALCYAAFGTLLNEHRRYSFIFSTIVLLTYIIRAVVGHNYCENLYIHFPLLSCINYYTDPILIILLLIHAIYCISYHFTKNRR